MCILNLKITIPLYNSCIAGLQIKSYLVPGSQIEVTD